MRRVRAVLLLPSAALALAGCATEVCACSPVSIVASVGGRVVDSNGAPVSGGNVGAYSAPASGCQSLDTDFGFVKAGDDGRFDVTLPASTPTDNVCIFVFARPPENSLGLQVSDTALVVLNFTADEITDSADVNLMLWGGLPLPQRSYSYAVTRTTGQALTFTGSSASWGTLAEGPNQGPPYDFKLLLASPDQRGDNDLANPLIMIDVRGDGAAVYPTRTNLRVGPIVTDIVRPWIGTSSGSYRGDSGTITLRPLNDTLLVGALDLWFTAEGGNPPPPSFHLVGSYVAGGASAVP